MSEATGSSLPKPASRLPQSSQLRQPSQRQGVPRLKTEASLILQSRRVTRRSMSAPDLRPIGVRPAASNASRRNVPIKAPAPTVQRTAPTAVGLHRKRPVAAVNGLPTNGPGGKRPLLQADGNKQVKTAPATKPVPQTTASKRKVAAWDTKGQLDIANSKIQRLQEEKENLLSATEQARSLQEEVGRQKQEIIRLTAELEQVLKEMKEVEEQAAQVEKLTEEKEQLTSQLNELKLQSSQLTQDLKLSQDQKFELQSKLDIVHEELSIAKSTITNLSLELETGLGRERKYLDEIFNYEQLRRKMHNQILDLKGNIRVFCRVRPPTSGEEKKLSQFEFPDESTVEIKPSQETVSDKSRTEKMSFTYDKVFPPNSCQNDIYLELSQLVQSALDGYNVCVFAYGQTGSGKTYTMEGGNDPETQGMIPRAIKSIFSSISDQSKLGWTFTVKCSFLEIYNENIRDLLNPNSTLPHDVRMTASNSEDVFVTNIKVEEVGSEEELCEHLARAQKNRFVAATIMNDRSSRSHSITQIKVEGHNPGRKTECQGTLNLIDLAGSERFRSENKSDRKVETCSINKSLASLSLVVLKLASKAEHIPFRDSKLTHLLMPSLKGNSKTLMLVNIAPFEDCYHETVTSLRFASRVSHVKVESKRQIKVSSVSNLSILKTK